MKKGLIMEGGAMRGMFTALPRHEATLAPRLINCRLGTPHSLLTAGLAANSPSMHRRIWRYVEGRFLTGRIWSCLFYLLVI